MADIENLLAGSSTAAPADPSRHGFWAWRERFVLAHLTAIDPDAGAADGIARAAYGDQRSRIRFLWWWTLLEVVAFLGFTLLLAVVEPSVAGPAFFNAAMVVGLAGLAVVVLSGSLLIHLWCSVIEGHRDQRSIDSLM